MSAHKLSTVQGTLCGYIEAEAAKASGILSGIKVAREAHGSAANDAAATIDESLSEGGTGVVMFVTFPMTSRADQNSGKFNAVLCGLTVMLMDNPTINLTLDPLEIVEAVWQAVLKRSDRGPQFNLGASPMDLITESDAARVYAINFDCLIQFQP